MIEESVWAHTKSYYYYSPLSVIYFYIHKLHTYFSLTLASLPLPSPLVPHLISPFVSPIDHIPLLSPSPELYFYFKDTNPPVIQSIHNFDSHFLVLKTMPGSEGLTGFYIKNLIYSIYSVYIVFIYSL